MGNGAFTAQIRLVQAPHQSIQPGMRFICKAGDFGAHMRRM